jgi:hypothetical protein
VPFAKGALGKVAGEHDSCYQIGAVPVKEKLLGLIKRMKGKGIDRKHVGRLHVGRLKVGKNTL